jgi:small-conductance mechanosensitive channel
MAFSGLLPYSPWVNTLIVACGAVLAAVIIRRVASRQAARMTEQRSIAGQIVRSTHAPFEAVIVLFALYMVWQSAEDELPAIQLVRHMTEIALIASLTWFAIRGMTLIGDVTVARFPSNVVDNLRARRVLTQSRVLVRSVSMVILIVGVSCALMTFPNVRQLGTSLLASAGVAGIAIGLAAKSVLGNMLAGLQIAIAQPIRIDDVLVVQGYWGRVEEITGTYVVIHVWDDRRLVVPLQWLIENPFENWTRTSSQITGSFFLYTDYGLPLDPLRREAERICKDAKEWDGRTCLIQVTDATEKSMQLRVLVTSQDSGQNWNLKCAVLEGLLAFIREHYPEFLPQLRVEPAARLANASASH